MKQSSLRRPKDCLDKYDLLKSGMSTTTGESASVSNVTYLSPPAPVHMVDEWFKIASITHFWIKRRFEVLRKIGRNLDFSTAKIGEIGCGHGMLQIQFEKYVGAKVDGFDLNDLALRESLAKNLPRFCYNIFDRNPQMEGRYDYLILFDVIEHIEKEKEFLEAVLYHLKPGGYLLINVPALMSLFSIYDTVAGHQRRYTLKSLEEICDDVNLQNVAATYWGLPLVPILLLRRIWLSGRTDPQQVVQTGFKPPGCFANWFLGFISTLEPIPQRWMGTSVMAIYRKPIKSSPDRPPQ